MAAREGNSKQSKGKKSRKYGRKRDSLTHKRYNHEQRWITNKIRKAQRHANKLGKSIRIKIEGEWETINPKKTAKNAGGEIPSRLLGVAQRQSAWFGTTMAGSRNSPPRIL